MRRHVAVVDGVRHARERAVQEALVSGLVPFPRMAEHLRGLDEGKGPGLHRLAWVGSRNDLSGYSQERSPEAICKFRLGAGRAVGGRGGTSVPHGAGPFSVPVGPTLDMVVARQAKEDACLCGSWLGWGTRRMLLGTRKRTIHDAGDGPLTTYRATMISSRASR